MRRPTTPPPPPVANAYLSPSRATRARTRQVVVPHLSHNGSALLRQAAQRRSVPLCRDPRRVLRVSPRSGRGTRVRPRRQRWSNKEAKRSAARASERRVGAAGASVAFARITVSGAAGTRSHRRRGSRDDPACAARGRDQHYARDMGNLHLPGVRQELPAGDLRARPWRPNQGGRDVAQRRTRSCR